MLSLRFSLCGRAHSPRRSLLVLFGALFATGCGSPTSPQTLGPILVCPANLTVQSPAGNAAPVVYDAPQVVAGEPPFRTKCSPESGAIFVPGTSTVTCTTTDGFLRTGSCAFTVTVASAPRLSATQFLAFGNSITEGKTASGAILQKSYPADLQAMLAARYISQTITMLNKGLGGEWAVNGVNRLPLELDANRPGALLLEEGVNDLVGGQPSSITPMIDALRAMLRQGKARGIPVFLATLPPEREGGSSASALPAIPEANQQIRLLALSEHVTLVDLYQGFGGNPDPYIDTDGLHPNELGYQKIAQLFFDAIRSTLELQPGSASSMELVRNMPSQNPRFARFR
jgi:lysophospholipase L1-like esterase